MIDGPREANGNRSNMELAVGSLLILFNQVASLRREISPPDIYVRPAIDSFSDGDFFRIREVLETCRWHRGRAAEILGISVRTLYRKIKAYGLDHEGQLV